MPAGEQLIVTLQGPLDPDAEYYQIQYDDNAGFTSPATTAQFYSLVRTVPALASGTTWHFRAKAGNGAGESTFSNVETGVPLVLEQPTLQSFTNVVQTGFTVTFNTVTNAQTYDLQIGTSPGASDEFNGTLLSTPSHTISGLLADTTYWCRARAVGLGNGAWSDNESVATPPVPGANITIGATASRTSATAPALVMLDLSTTTGVSTSKPLHELDFFVNWNDGGQGAWRYGDTNDKNLSFGPIVGHVYTQPGTYNIAVTVRDADGDVAVDLDVVGNVTISDPDTVFGGGATHLISRDGIFPQAGTYPGANEVTTTNWATVQGLANNNGERLLFRRNEVWPSIAGKLFVGQGTHIGAYGTGTDPEFQLEASASDFAQIQDGTGSTLMDLDINGQGGPPGWSALAGDLGVRIRDVADHPLLLRCTIRGFIDGVTAPYDFQDTSGDEVTYLGIHECDILDSRNNALRIATSGASVQGNLIEGSFDGDLVHFQAAQDLCFAHNRLRRAPSQDPTSYALLRINAPDFAGEAGLGYWSTASLYSEKLVLADNIFEAGDWNSDSPPNEVIVIQNALGIDQRIRDLLFLRNLGFIIGTGDITGTSDLLRFLVAGVDDATIVANLIEATGGNPGATDGLITLERLSPLARPDDAVILHNTLVRNGPTAEILVRNDGDNTIIRGNIIAAPAGSTLFTGNGTGASQADNTPTNLYASAPFVLTQPIDSDSFKPEDGFYGVSGGSPLTITRRAFRRKDAQLFDILTPDMGAWDLTVQAVPQSSLLDQALVFDELTTITVG